MISSKDLVNKKENNISNFNPIEKSKNDKYFAYNNNNTTSNNKNLSPINNSQNFLKNNFNLNNPYGNNSFKNNIPGIGITNYPNISLKSNIFENKTAYNEKKYRNASMESHYNHFVNNSNNNILNNQISGFNISEYSHMNNYSVEKKNQYFKSSIGKNALIISKQNQINKLVKNNNFNFDMTPLKNSLTIEKINTPTRNKLSNKTVQGKAFDNDVWDKLNNNNARGNVNPFTLNNNKDNNNFAINFNRENSKNYNKFENENNNEDEKKYFVNDNNNIKEEKSFINKRKSISNKEIANVNDNNYDQSK